MTRAAVFVEGETEAAFVRELIKFMAAGRSIAFIGERQFGGFFVQEYADSATKVEYEILIANCCNDARVSTSIRERYNALISAGYTAILGLRDLYPIDFADLEKLRAGISSTLPSGPVNPSVVVAVSEVEAWFIEEISHFSRVDPALTETTILAVTGYDISSRSAESIRHPADMLNTIYQTVGLAWRKKQKQVDRMMSVLDYSKISNDVRLYSASLNEFMVHLDAFLV